jgi:putative peptidoglycan lipid II flippase
MPTQASGPAEAPSAPRDDHASIGRRAGVVALGTLASRVLGAVRDAAVAAFYSVAATDAFVVAWTIPNTLRRVLGEGAVSAAIVPTFSEVRETQGREPATRYVAAITGAMLLILAAVSVIGILTSHYWTTLYAAGFRTDADKFDTTVLLTQLCFPYILLVGIAALGMGLLNAVGRFAVPAFAPALLNVAVIVAPFAFVPLAIALGLPTVTSLALATLVGGVLQMVVQFPSLRREGLLPMPVLDFRNPAVRKTLLLMLPLVLGSGIYQLNIMLSRLLSSYLPAGSPSFLYYAQRVVEIPQSMFALSMASAALPSLARQRNLGQHAEAHDTLRYSLRQSLFIAIPASVALVVLAEPVVCVLFGRGHFEDFSVRQTGLALACMAGSTWAVAVIHPLTRMYYAYNDTRTPVWCSALNLVAFLGTSVLLVNRFGHAAIALGTSAGSVVQLVGLWLMLPRKVGPIALGEVVRSALRCALASVVMGFVLYDVSRFGSWSTHDSFVRNALLLCGIVPFGIAVYAAACMLLRAPEIDELGRMLGRRLRRTS